MRFLLTAVSKPARRSVAAAIESSSSSPKAAWTTPHIASKEKNHASKSAQEANTTTTTNFGQQCGPHCGCVVRLELDVSAADNDQTVRTGQYTAKRVLLAKNGTPLRTSKGRLQYTSSQCPTLHRLLPQAIQFFQNKSLAKLQTYTDFCGHRSSPAFGQAVLQQHGLLVGAKNKNNNNKRGCAACFDLVEDVVTAAVRGYLPAPRRKPPQNNPNYYPGVDEEDDDDDYYRETAAAAAPPPTSLREQATADWTASLLWPFSSRDNDETAATYSHFSTSNGSTTSEPEIQQPSKWTALDWIDYWEQQQRQQEEEEEQAKQQETNGGSTHQGGASRPGLALLRGFVGTPRR